MDLGAQEDLAAYGYGCIWHADLAGEELHLQDINIELINRKERALHIAFQNGSDFVLCFFGFVNMRFQTSSSVMPKLCTEYWLSVVLSINRILLCRSLRWPDGAVRPWSPKISLVL